VEDPQPTPPDVTLAAQRVEQAAEAEEKQKTRQVAESVLAVLQSRGIPVDEESKKKILETEKRETLEGWLVRSATAKSVKEVMEE